MTQKLFQWSAYVEWIKERVRGEAKTVKSIMLLEDFTVKRSRKMRQRTREDCFNG